jgi:hypothetical protein
MKYLQPTFSVGPAAKSTACEKCVYGSGEHAEWCVVQLTESDKKYYAALFPFVTTRGGNYRTSRKPAWRKA